MKYTYNDFKIPISKKNTGKISFITDLTATNSDMDSNIHKGFTIGKGKTLYWYITWCKSGNAMVYRETDEGLVKRYVSGDQEITVHFK